ncbi:MAG: hypothetical protein ACRDJL_03835, partial [Actinomycetota bacterium]
PPRSHSRKDRTMSRPKLQSLMTATLSCFLTLCVFGLLFVSQAEAMRASRSKSQSPALTQTAAKSKLPFEIAGEIDDLYPGARVPLNVRVTNPHDHPLRVRSIEVEVQDSGRAGCGREWVRPGRNVRISALVPPKSSAFLSYPVWMLDDAPATCQGATWTLDFEGTGSVLGTQVPPDEDNPPDDGAADPENDNDSVLPFTGFSLLTIVGLALASILLGLILLLRRRWEELA